MTETILSGLCLAVISAATFVAYNHPKKFVPVGTLGMALSLFVFLVATIFNVSVFLTENSIVSELLDQGHLEAAKYLHERETESSSVFGPASVSFIIFCFLLILTEWVAKLKNDED